MTKKLKKVCALLSILCLSVGVLPTSFADSTVYAETQPQRMKDKYSVTTKNISKPLGETVTKVEILAAVTTTATGQTPVTKTLVNTYEKLLPMKVEKEGYYSFPVQVIYKDKSIAQVTVQVVTVNYATTEKRKLKTALDELLALYRENPNLYGYTKDTQEAYRKAQTEAREPYYTAKNAYDTPDTTLATIQQQTKTINERAQKIKAAKEALQDRITTSEEAEQYKLAVKQLMDAIQSEVNTKSKTPESIAKYETVKQQAQELLNASLGKENGIFNEVLNDFKKLVAIKSTLITAQKELDASVSQAQQYNPKGKEIIASIGDTIAPIDGIENFEASLLPEGTAFDWSYGAPSTEQEINKAQISIKVTYPDGSTDNVASALTVLPIPAEVKPVEDKTVSTTKTTKTFKTPKATQPSHALPKTGDSTVQSLWVSLLVLSFAAMGFACLKKGNNSVAAEK